MNNSYVFDIEGAGTWTVRSPTAASPSTRATPAATARSRLGQETFEKVVKGEQNPTAAYMSGKMKTRATWARR
jgi:hypothetical protein